MYIYVKGNWLWIISNWYSPTWLAECRIKCVKFDGERGVLKGVFFNEEIEGNSDGSRVFCVLELYHDSTCALRVGQCTTLTGVAGWCWWDDDNNDDDDDDDDGKKIIKKKGDKGKSGEASDSSVPQV